MLRWLGVIVGIIGSGGCGSPEIHLASSTGAPSGTGGNPTTGGGGAGGTSSSGGSSTSGAGATGAGGSGGATSSTTTTTTGPCQPSSDPCAGGTKCGDVDDGCGAKVMCDTCTGPQSCVNEKCCVQVDCSAYPSACGGGQEDDGCGTPIFCGAPTCGDGKWMTCEQKTCACADAYNYDNSAGAVVTCEKAFPDAMPDMLPYYCGAPSSQIPKDCKSTGMQNMGVPGKPIIWCCPKKP